MNIIRWLAGENKPTSLTITSAMEDSKALMIYYNLIPRGTIMTEVEREKD